MRVPLVAANWKMHGRLAMLGEYVAAFSALQEGRGVEVAICPPAPYLGALAVRLPDLGAVWLGAQDCSSEPDDGAFTGEVSANMLLDVGCRWVIVGHSERRQRFAESNELVAAKFVAALNAGLAPIVCVGESAQERADGRAEAVVLAQLEAVIERAGAERMADAAIAYEPVWAIGSGEPATPEAAQAMHRKLREAVSRRSSQAADSVRVLYGGSVKPANASAFFGQADVDGALVGGAALDPDAFRAIIDAAAEARGG